MIVEFKAWIETMKEYETEQLDRAAHYGQMADAYEKYDPEIARLMRAQVATMIAIHDHIRSRTERR